jgi:hypothetical protein
MFGKLQLISGPMLKRKPSPMAPSPIALLPTEPPSVTSG